MHRFIGGQDAYSLLNTMAYYALLFSIPFFFVLKRKSLCLISRGISKWVSGFNNTLGKVTEFVLAFIETYIIVRIIDYSSYGNRILGGLVGTGANYFAEFIGIPLFCILFSIITVANPLKQLDFAIVLAPIQLILFKLSCYCNGCCWGIPWDKGPYNYHYDHPGNQVPVQLIEMAFAIIIFIFLLFYRRKAKTGTIYPMYLTLFSFTRFFAEFFKADYPNIIGPFNMYQILSTIGFVVGLILLLVMRRYGEKISDAYDKKVNSVVENILQKKADKIAEENAMREADMKERLEKAKAARAKASVKYKKK